LPKFLPDVRRWIRHNKDLQGFLSVFPAGSADPSSPRLIAPWLSDTVQLTMPVLPNLSSITVAAAAGAEWTRQIDANQAWKLISLSFVFTTDANVATRHISIELIDRRGLLVWRGRDPQTQTASAGRQVSMSALGDDLTNFGTNDQHILCHPNFWMPQGFILRSNTLNLQAGDAYTLVHLFFEHWPG